MIKKYIKEHAGEIFDAGYLYERFFLIIPRKTYLKIIERFVDEGILQRISKGVYLIGEQKEGINPILEFYTSNYSGMVFGQQMYYELGLIDTPGAEIELLSARITTNTKNIKNYKLKHVDLFFISETIEVIQGLECIANVSKLVDYDSKKFLLVLERLVKSYDDFTFKSILRHLHYDFSTIDAVAKILKEHKIANNVIAIYENSIK